MRAGLHSRNLDPDSDLQRNTVDSQENHLWLKFVRIREKCVQAQGHAACDVTHTCLLACDRQAVGFSPGDVRGDQRQALAGQNVPGSEYALHVHTVALTAARTRILSPLGVTGSGWLEFRFLFHQKHFP